MEKLASAYEIAKEEITVSLSIPVAVFQISSNLAET